MTKAELAARVADATGGKVWTGGSVTRVYVRDGRKQGYVEIVSESQVDYSRDLQHRMYNALASAGIVRLDDISTVVC